MSQSPPPDSNRRPLPYHESPQGTSDGEIPRSRLETARAEIGADSGTCRTASTQQVPAVVCTTFDCGGRATRYVSCEGEGRFAYCDECADILVRGGEIDGGAVDDPVVAERDALRALVCDVADSGVAFEDPRLNYVEVQIDRDTWESIRAATRDGGNR
jgi:hypothetical protein